MQPVCPTSSWFYTHPITCPSVWFSVRPYMSMSTPFCGPMHPSIVRHIEANREDHRARYRCPFKWPYVLFLCASTCPLGASWSANIPNRRFSGLGHMIAKVGQCWYAKWKIIYGDSFVSLPCHRMAQLLCTVQASCRLVICQVLRLFIDVKTPWPVMYYDM